MARLMSTPGLSSKHNRKASSTHSSSLNPLQSVLSMRYSHKQSDQSLQPHYELDSLQDLFDQNNFQPLQAVFVQNNSPVTLFIAMQLVASSLAYVCIRCLIAVCASVMQFQPAERDARKFWPQPNHSSVPAREASGLSSPLPSHCLTWTTQQ